MERDRTEMVTRSLTVQVRPQRPLSITISKTTLKGTLKEIRDKKRSKENGARDFKVKYNVT